VCTTILEKYRFADSFPTDCQPHEDFLSQLRFCKNFYIVCYYSLNSFFNQIFLRIYLFRCCVFSVARRAMFTGICHGTKSSGLLSYNLLHTHTHTSDLQQFEIFQDASEQSNVQIKPLTQCKQTFSPPFGPPFGISVTSLKIEWVNLPVSAESHFACYALISDGLAKIWKSLGDNILSKMEPSNATCLLCMVTL
jgi:hypothetical protein